MNFEDRNYDLFLIDYTSEQALKESPCEYYLAQPDAKWFSTADAVDQLGDRLDNYQYIWCPDDDLFIRPEDINGMFAFAKKLRLDLGQPSVTRNSYYSHRITLKIPMMSYRLTSFVEIMAPFFTPSMMRQAHPFFKVTKTGWGMDHIWQKMEREEKLRMGIIDRYAIAHTRPSNAPKKSNRSEFGGGFYAQAKANPWDDMDKIAEKYDGKPLPRRNRWAVLRGGLPIHPYLAKRFSKLVMQITRR